MALSKTFFAKSPQCSLNQLPTALMEHLFSFLDDDSRIRLTLIKSQNPDLWSRLLQQALKDHFLKLVAWAEPPQYKLKEMSECKPEDSLTIFIEVKNEVFMYKAMNHVSTIEPYRMGLILKDNSFEEIKKYEAKILERIAERSHIYTTEAERILEMHIRLKQLISQKANVTDAAGNHFTDITGYQYARWARDVPMCVMLEKYMTAQEIEKQCNEMKSDKFKMQHGSYWDCPKEYDLHLLTIDDESEIKALQDRQLIEREKPLEVPTLIFVEAQSKFYLVGDQYSLNGIANEFTLLDGKKFNNVLPPYKKIHITNTEEYRALHEEIESKEAHVVNPLTSALQEFADNVDGEQLKTLSLKIGMAQRRIPMHIVNEYCRLDRSFYPTPEFNGRNFLPRTRIIEMGNILGSWSWYPLRHNQAPFTLNLKLIDQAPSLISLQEEAQGLMPIIFKKLNEQGPADFYVFGLDSDTHQPTLKKIPDPYNRYFETNFNFTREYTTEYIIPKKHETMLELPIMFSSLGFGCSVNRGTFICASQANHLSEYLRDLYTISKLCLERRKYFASDLYYNKRLGN